MDNAIVRHGIVLGRRSKVMQRIAILGGNGFVGTNLRKLLKSSEHQVEIFSRTTGCDLSDMSTAWKAIDGFRPSVIVNCAAVVGSVNFVSDFAADVIDQNMRIILNTYKIAQNMHDTVIINPVANCAYPGDLNDYEESKFWDGAIHPSVLAYGSTRRMMLAFSESYRRQHGVRSVNLFVPNIYGPYDSTNPNKTHALNALVIKFVKAIKHNQESIEIWGTGKPIREWLYVKDFARIVTDIVANENYFSEPINIAQNHGETVRALVDALVNITGYSGEIVYNTQFQDGAAKKVMNDTLFRKKFPEFKFTDITKGIEETIEFYDRVLQ